MDHGEPICNILALILVGVFVYFIHHISSSIQVSAISCAISRETMDLVEHFFPEKCGGIEDEELPAMIGELEWQPIPARVMGYIQTVDVTSLAAFAEKHKVILKMEYGVGDFVTPYSPILSFSGPESFRDVAVDALEQFFAVDTYRTIEQDPAFGIRQLVDIALKALSPSINDTTTAVNCIEHLSVILMSVAQRHMPSPLHCERGVLRVIAKQPCFEQLVVLSFHQILENAEGNTEILLRLIDAIARIVTVTTLKKRTDVLRQWMHQVGEVGLRSVKSGYALDEIKRHIVLARDVLDKGANRLNHSARHVV
ncbi:MAG TPA: DUF2254 domain-containing protein [Noviherbaspirillum sp.]